MKRFPWMILSVGVTCAAILFVADRPVAAQSPASWRQLSLSDFVREIDQLTSGSEPVSDALWTEIRGQSAERLLQAMAGQSQADYGDLVSLYLWSRPSLSEEQVAAVLAGLNPRANQASGWTFEKLLSVQIRMEQAQLPADSIHGLTLAWLENRDVRTLENVDQLGWLFAQLQIMERKEIGRQEFSVRWTGTVQAPVDGVYTFSICPLDLNFEHMGTSRQQSTKIWLADQQILDSTGDGWTFQSSGVTLSAAAPMPIRVELSYACSSQGVIYDRPAIGLLYWEAAGLSRQLVPSSALSTPDGSHRGLQGDYQLQESGQEVVAQRVDAQLNFIWYHQNFILSPHDELRQQLADQLYAVASSVGTLASWEDETYTNVDPWQVHWGFLESLSVSRHKPWVELLAAHDVLLEKSPSVGAVNLYRRCRVGAADETLQAVGQWALVHADMAPVLAVDFQESNREVSRLLGQMMAIQYPSHLKALEQEYLQLPDGGCVLPVAYMLAHGYWMQGRIGEWIDRLEARLADPQVAGDGRVNWLLARAQAEEIRESPANQHWYPIERSLAGRGWLEEASLVAQSEPERLRVFQELAARLAAQEQLAAAGKVLDQAQERCSSSISVAALDQWRDQLKTFEEAFQTRRDQQEALAREAYLERLKARHVRAVDSGDEAAASRYERLLSKAGAASE